MGILSKFNSNPGVEHWRVAVDVLSYVVGTKEKGVMLGDVQKVEKGIIGFADSDWANDTDDRKSVSGGALFIEGSLVEWFSRKQGMVCTSTAEAEIHAVLEMVQLVKAAKSVWDDLLMNFFQGQPKVPIIFSDSQPGLDAISLKRARGKHYDIKVKYIAEGVAAGEFSLRYIPTSSNVADVFTKALRAVRFNALAQFLISRVEANSEGFRI